MHKAITNKQTNQRNVNACTGKAVRNALVKLCFPTTENERKLMLKQTTQQLYLIACAYNTSDYVNYVITSALITQNK